MSSQHQPGPWEYNQDNQLQGYGVGIERRTYTYNPNGHTETEVTGDPATKTREFIYNAVERLTEIKDNGQTIGQYQYDPMGRRIKKQTNDGTTWFLYANEGLIAELDQTGNPTRYYGWKPNSLWGTDPLWLADKSGSTWQAYLYHNDHLWTPQRLTSVQGEIQWGARSEAFGKTAATINTIDNPLRFPGQYEDKENSIHYNLFRYYVPKGGAYVELDPLGAQSRQHLFSYAMNSPLRYIDYNGLLGFVPRPHWGPSEGNTIECDGSGNVRPKIGDPFDGPCSIILNTCLWVHEMSHVITANSRSPGVCRGQPEGTPLDWDDTTTDHEQREEERRAYRNELSCLRMPDDLSNKCFPDSDCAEQVKKRRRCVEYYVNNSPPMIYIGDGRYSRLCPD